jgi:hypothetical protein
MTGLLEMLNFPVESESLGIGEVCPDHIAARIATLSGPSLILSPSNLRGFAELLDFHAKAPTT